MAGRMTHSPNSLFDFGPEAVTYERWYDTPTGRAHDRVQKQDVRTMLRPAKAREQLLDVGCGTGHWSRFFRSLGYQVNGVDVSPEMIAVARAALPGCAFEVGDARALPFKDESFAVVASMATLEFIPDAAAAVREMARCAKPGGAVLIGTLNRSATLNQQRLSSGQQPYASANLLAPDELEELLRPYGSVRMVASPVERSGARLVLARALRRYARKPQPALSGPFIVAEARE